ncbi:MAG: GNAT family N-acetyltransferase, partial [Clostridia bacterium]|nr:GNAT family N-acetyltransferase [Clostridia bacterium]
DYLTQMDELYLPLERKVDSGEFFKFSAMQKVIQRYIRQGYTAHLHIYILEEYQSQGLGTQLINALEAKLKEAEVEGVFLICDKKNKQANDFFQQCGYDDIDYITGAIVYGKKFLVE